MDVIKVSQADGVNQHTLQIEIRSDSYQNQCYARVKRWDGEKWQLVHFIPNADMKTPKGLAYMDGGFERQFVSDRQDLINVASAILGVE